MNSRLISFGRIEGGAATVYETLRGQLGEGATIAVPSYTFGLNEEGAFDPQQTPSMDVGILSEYVRRLPGAARSACPIHSHAAIGPSAFLLNAVTGDVSLGPGSDFEVFEKNEFQLLLLGCEFEDGATFIHHIEAEVGVPYRAWTELSRRCIVGGREVRRKVKYYARSSNQWIEDFAKVRVRLENAGLLTGVKCPIGHSYLVPLDTLANEVRTMLREEPYSIVRAAEVC